MFFHGSNRVQNSRMVFWPRAAEVGFQNPSPLGEGFGPTAAKRVSAESQAHNRPDILAVSMSTQKKGGA